MYNSLAMLRRNHIGASASDHHTAQGGFGILSFSQATKCCAWTG